MQEARFNIYVPIHKALRASMCENLVQLGQVDAEDDAALGSVLEKVDSLLLQCQHHLEHENEFVHSAMLARRPGLKLETASDHEHHTSHIAQLRGEIARIQNLPALRRTQALMDLYREFALFVADNFQHMHIEETHNSRVLWECYSDGEILEIEHRIIASLPPEESAATMEAMLPVLNHGERLNILRGMREGMPAEAFDGVLQMLEAKLNRAEWLKLCGALGLPIRGEAA